MIARESDLKAYDAPLPLGPHFTTSLLLFTKNSGHLFSISPTNSETQQYNYNRRSHI
jgi:hypothetical protein